MSCQAYHVDNKFSVKLKHTSASDDAQSQKPYGSRSRPHKASGEKSLSLSHSCVSQSKGSISSSRGTKGVMGCPECKNRLHVRISVDDGVMGCPECKNRLRVGISADDYQFNQNLMGALVRASDILVGFGN